MNEWVGVIIVLAVVGALSIALWAVAEGRRRKTRRLRRGFGAEYDRAVTDFGGRRPAEAELEQRRMRIACLHIRPLSAADSKQFEAMWQSAQAHFLDDPPAGVTDADAVVTRV